MRKNNSRMLILVLLILCLGQTKKLSHYRQENWHQIIYTSSFPQGALYQIICQDGTRALAIGTTNNRQYNSARIIGVSPNANDLRQLFFIEKTSSSEDSYQIINAISNNVWDEQFGQIRLRPSNKGNDQLFYIQKLSATSYLFKLSLSGSVAVSLAAVLVDKKFDPNSLSQLFYITPVTNSLPIQQTCIVESSITTKAISVPLSIQLYERGAQLIISEKDKRFGQRWKWIKSGLGFFLQNMLSNNYIQIKEESKQSRAAVVQSSKTGFNNQLWIPVTAGPGQWKIRSVHAPNLYLSIQNESTENGAKIVVKDGSSSSQIWKIQGFVPII